MTYQTKITRFTFPFYAFNALQNCIFVYAVDKIVFLSRGVSLLQVGILLALWTLMELVLELPTGILADKWNRKYLLVMSGLAYLLCYVTWFGSHSFIGFLIGFAFRSIGSCLASGTLQAYLYDYLQSRSRTDDFERLWGRGRMYNQIGTAVALATGGILAARSLSLVLGASIIPCALLIIAALAFPSVPRRQLVHDTDHPVTFLLSGLHYAFRHPRLIDGLLLSGLVIASWGLIDEYIAVYFRWVGYPLAAIGLLYAALYVAASSAGLVAHRLRQLTPRMAHGIPVIATGVLIVSGLVRSWVIIVPFIAVAFLIEALNVLNDGSIQRHAPDDKRAMIASLNSLFQGSDILLALIFGVVSQRYGIAPAFLFVGVSMLLYPLQYVIRRAQQQDAPAAPTF